jgi:hypothetical protein
MTEVVSALTRASGLVAAVLSVAALVSGSLFSARETGRRIRPAWWLDLHNGLGGLALMFVALHVVVSVLDADVDVGAVEALVPGAAATDRDALALGVLATYLTAAAVFTTWPRRLHARRLWRVIHVGSIAAVAFGLLHGYEMGSDAQEVAVRIGLVAIVAPATYALGVRVFDLSNRQRRGDRGEDSQPTLR